MKNKNIGIQETNLLSLSYGKIIRKNIETTFGLLPENFEGYNIIQENDIVLRLTDLQNDHKSLRVGIAKEKGIITSAYLTLRSQTNKIAKYFYYLLHSFDIVKGFYGMGAGVRQGLNWSEVRSLRIIVPPLSEQQRIANFLDEKVSQIDSTISKTRESIEEYKKLKQAIITEAVTKGLNPNAKMKDSGIEWIGEIPEEWEVRKIKPFLKWKSIKGCGNEVVLSLYRDYGVLPKDSRDDNHNVTSLDTDSYKLVDIGDFVINKMKAWQGSMAVSKFRGIISPAYHVCSFVSSQIYKPYFHYLMRNKSYLTEYERLSSGLRIGQWDLSFEDFCLIRFLLPPLHEQQQIADFLDKKCSEIDKLITKKEQLVVELEAYKKSLIYEVVTGKRSV